MKTFKESQIAWYFFRYQAFLLLAESFPGISIPGYECKEASRLITFRLLLVKIFVGLVKSPVLVIARSSAYAGRRSTDANLPISLGIPAVTLNGGGKSENNHSPSESFDPTDAYMGPQRIFLMILGLVGVEGVNEPLLPKRK